VWLLREQEVPDRRERQQDPAEGGTRLGAPFFAAAAAFRLRLVRIVIPGLVGCGVAVETGP